MEINLGVNIENKKKEGRRYERNKKCSRGLGHSRSETAVGVMLEGVGASKRR